mmetsp:Transcript_5785/g.35932  ORF Transcript_5785/g.35932 Transcript_5785/m.35932 type:complete len:207 (+) Transcript_5785:3229-3849(+)
MTSFIAANTLDRSQFSRAKSSPPWRYSTTTFSSIFIGGCKPDQEIEKIPNSSLSFSNTCTRRSARLLQTHPWIEMSITTWNTSTRNLDLLRFTSLDLAKSLVRKKVERPNAEVNIVVCSPIDSTVNCSPSTSMSSFTSKGCTKKMNIEVSKIICTEEPKIKLRPRMELPTAIHSSRTLISKINSHTTTTIIPSKQPVNMATLLSTV